MRLQSGGLPNDTAAPASTDYCPKAEQHECLQDQNSRDRREYRSSAPLLRPRICCDHVCLVLRRSDEQIGLEPVDSQFPGPVQKLLSAGVPQHAPVEPLSHFVNEHDLGRHRLTRPVTRGRDSTAHPGACAVASPGRFAAGRQLSQRAVPSSDPTRHARPRQHGAPRSLRRRIARPCCRRPTAFPARGAERPAARAIANADAARADGIRRSPHPCSYRPVPRWLSLHIVYPKRLLDVRKTSQLSRPVT
jgi:hypothetical protein